MTALAKIFTQISDQRTRVEYANDHILYAVDRCPACWGQQSKDPICFVATGLLEEGLRWISGGREYRVEEIECIAAGNDACIFTIENNSIG